MAESQKSNHQSENSEQDLSAGKLVDLEPDELQNVSEPASRLAGYNQNQHLETGDDALQHGDDDSVKSAIAGGGNQTEAVNQQTALEQATANENEVKTAN